MNTKQSKTAAVLLLAGFVVAAGGCATFRKPSGVDLAEKTSASMETVNADTRQVALQIDVTKATLNNLLKMGRSSEAQPEDVKKTYDTFAQNVSDMEDLSKTLNKHIDDMNTQGNEYFEKWSEETGTYTSPKIQKLSEQRRSRLDSTFREMHSATARVRAPLNSYLAEVTQIRSYLSNDLTPMGVSAIVPIAKAAERDGAAVKKSFIPVQNAIMQARTELTPGGGVAAGGGPAKQQPKQKKTEEQKMPQQ